MTVEEELVISKHAHLRKVDNDPVNIARRALKSLEINPLPDQKTERIIKELESMPRAPHDDTQDAMAFSIPSTAGILGAAAVLFNPELKEKVHVDIPREPDIFKPTKSMLDILSERIDSDLNKRLTEFGDKNGFPVVFVFYQTLKSENGVSKATCDIKMFKSDEKQDARLFALQHAGEFGIFDPRSKDEQIKDLEKKVKLLEEDRDYWKRKAEGDDDDTLGLFKHWDD